MSVPTNAPHGQENNRPPVTALDRYTNGWPEKPPKDGGAKKQAGVAYSAPLERLLTTDWAIDLHYTQYITPHVEVQTEHGPRFADDLRMNEGAEFRIPGGYAIVLFAVDVDGPMHAYKKALDDAKKAKNEALVAKLEAGRPAKIVEHEAWWVVERAKVERLRLVDPIYAYRTGGGYRLLGWLPSAEQVWNDASYDAHIDRYMLRLAHLSVRFGIVGDAATKYPICLFRLPRVMRNGVAQKPETIGDPSNVGTWSFAGLDEAACRNEIAIRWYTKPRGEARADGAPRQALTPGEITKRWDGFTEAEQERRIALYRKYLGEEEGASPGCPPMGSSSNFTLIIARTGVIGLGIDPDLVLDMMLTDWNPKCHDGKGRPWPWTEDELRHKVDSAAQIAPTEKKPLDFELPEIKDKLHEDEISSMFPWMRRVEKAVEEREAERAAAGPATVLAIDYPKPPPMVRVTGCTDLPTELAEQICGKLPPEKPYTGPPIRKKYKSTPLRKAAAKIADEAKERARDKRAGTSLARLLVDGAMIEPDDPPTLDPIGMLAGEVVDLLGFWLPVRTAWASVWSGILYEPLFHRHRVLSTDSICEVLGKRFGEAQARKMKWRGKIGRQRETERRTSDAISLMAARRMEESK